ncbi:response regulator transcription factor [Photobacterium sp. TY1-4]|uniref:response regulator transcription factor n=1 Tax=Photobacterium sp. TY1-4 TaxID=2899122 RepID=UPI0021C04A6F|nr:response regulator transcription factor [Photobacterium sp. TY1-4]UXI02171.1 response regulator transcription factor [Photobacterium sp. TY1-4]
MSHLERINILIIEDDLKLAGLIQNYLEQQGFTVRHAETGQQGLQIAREMTPQLIILDLMLPVMNGLAVCRELKSWYKELILVLTASDDDMDQVALLEMGADDFVHKPIHPRVLLARVRALLRRYEHQPASATNERAEQLNFGQLTLHLGRRLVQLNDKPVNLTEMEFELLWLLASNPEKPLSRDDISLALRGIEHDGLDRSIDNRIVSLRRKLGDHSGVPRRIITVRGKGYLFVTDRW